MFGPRRNDEDKALAEALLKGIKAGRAKHAQNKGALQDAFNAASGLLGGLEALREQSNKAEGSQKFDFTTTEAANHVAIRIDSLNVDINVYRSGLINVFDNAGGYAGDSPIIISRKGKAEKTLQYVGKRAAAAGMIP